MNYFEQEDTGGSALKLAAGITIAGGLGTLGLTVAMVQMDARFAAAVLFIGLAITAFFGISIIFGAWSSMNHRANLAAESRNALALADAKRIEAEAEKAIEAARLLGVRADLLNQPQLPAPRHVAVPTPERDVRINYPQRQRVVVDQMADDRTQAQADDLELDPPAWTQSGQDSGLDESVTLTLTEDDARIIALANAIAAGLKNRMNPSRKNVLAHVDGRLIKQEGDITRALDWRYMNVGDVTPPQQGRPRYWTNADGVRVVYSD